MRYIVKRIDGEFAVCQAEDRSMVNMPLIQLQPGIQEGDSINIEEDVVALLPLDHDGKKRIKALTNDLKDI